MTEINDPILHETEKSYSIFPIKYPRLYDLYHKAVACFWTEEEVDLSKDVLDWEKLTDNERHFIEHVLAFFSNADGIVNENLAVRFFNDVAPQEAKFFYGFQIAVENIHAITYALLIKTYVKDQAKADKLVNSVNTMPVIQKKAEWIRQWIDSKDATFAKRLVGMACCEMIFFSGSFCAIFWLKERGIMPGLAFSNELISRDEALHTEFAVTLHDHLLPENRISEEDATAMVREAVAVETEFICEALPCALLGMNSKSMTEYIKFVADRLLKQLGFKATFGATMPFPFMNRIGLNGSSNFFETRVSEYQRANIFKQETVTIDEHAPDDF